MRRPHVVLILLALVLGLGAWMLLRAAASDPSLAPKERADAASTRPVGEIQAPRDPSFPSPAPSATAPLVIDKAKRDEMRELIWKAFGQAAPPASAPPSNRYVLPEHGAMWTGKEGTGVGAHEPGIEPEYIRDSVRTQFFPVAKKCYADALADSASLHGEIDLWFVIVGDAKIGGIVESVDVLNKSTLRDPDLIECMRESFLGVTFPPPKGGGFVTVEYPIVFSPEEDAGEQD